MPCYTPSSEEMCAYDYADEQVKIELERARAEWEHNSPVSELLCSTMKWIETNAPTGAQSLPDGVASWWQRHKWRDKMREEILEKSQGLNLGGILR